MSKRNPTSDKNKLIVKEAKVKLKELGHDIPTGHIYELFARLGGDKSWNVSAAKQIDFSQIINRNSESKSNHFDNLYGEINKLADKHLEDKESVEMNMRVLIFDFLIKAKSDFLTDPDTAHESMNQGIYEIKLQSSLDKIKQLNKENE